MEKLFRYPDGLVSGMPDSRILEPGDLMIDVYIRGDVARVSHEATVPIVGVNQETPGPGGAANVTQK